MAMYGAGNTIVRSPYLVVAAIDFGSTYSGYGFSLTSHQEDIKCYTKWGTECGIGATHKTPSCILLDDKGEFVDFGYAAVNKFSALEEDDQRSHALFENFKMELYRSKDPENVRCQSSQKNRECSLMKLVTMSLKYFKKHMLHELEERTNQSWAEADIRWVVTVPAIWDDRAKNFMKKAAIQAGLVGENEPDRFILALEPEAAAVYCHKVEVNLQSASSPDGMTMTPGTRFLVVDAGGGTLDMTAQEVINPHQMAVLHCANGDALGGALVDQKIMALITEIVGDEVTRRYQGEFYADYKMMKDQVEKLKKTTGSSDNSNTVNVGLSLAFGDTYDDVTGNDVSDCVGVYWHDRGVCYSNGFLRIPKDKILEAFDSVVKSITEMIGNILSRSELSGVSHIIMVGGFSESRILQNAIREKFSKYKVVIPSDTCAVVLKGAVLYGHRTEVITARRSGKTYAVSDWRPYVEGVHDDTRKVRSDDGQDLVKRCAHVLVKKGDEVNTDSVQTVIVAPVYRGQTSIPVELYCTDKMAPLYVDEEDVMRLANLSVSLPGSGMDREIKVNFRFGGTQIEVEGIDLAGGQPVSVAVQFLSEPCATLS